MNTYLGKQIWGMVVLVAIGVILSTVLSGDRVAVIDDRKDDSLSLFEAIISEDDSATFKVVNYSSITNVYVVGFQMGIQGETTEYSRDFLDKAIFDGINKLNYETIVSSVVGEYTLFFSVRVRDEDEKEFSLRFDPEMRGFLEGKKVFIKKILYRKAYNLSSKIYEADVDIVLPIKFEEEYR